MASKKITSIESVENVARYQVLGQQIDALNAQMAAAVAKVKALTAERDALKNGLIQAAGAFPAVEGEKGITYAGTLYGFSVSVVMSERAAYTVPAGVRYTVKVGE